MNPEDATNPAAGDSTDLSIAADETEVEAHDGAGHDDAGETYEADGDAEEAEPLDEDELEDIEYAGRRHRIPKALKPAMMMHADYTRKTQALAAERQALHGQVQAFQQAGQGEIDALAELRAIDGRLAQYAQIDWQAWTLQDPTTAQAAFMDYQQLKDQRSATTAQHARHRIARETEAAAHRATRLHHAHGVLTRDVPGWNAGRAQATLEGGIREYGFDRSEIEDFEDARMVKVLVDALAWREHRARADRAQGNLRAQQAQPIPRLKPSGAAVRGLSDKLSAEEWVKRRNEQVRRRT